MSEIPRTDARPGPTCRPFVRLPGLHSAGGLCGARAKRSRTNTPALGSKVEGVQAAVEQTFASDHFGTAAINDVISKLGALEPELSFETIKKPFEELLANATAIRDGLIPDPSTAAFKPHFGTEAVVNLVNALGDWVQGGMDMETLQSTLADVKASLSAFVSLSPGHEFGDVASSTLKSITQLQGMLGSGVEAGGVAGPIVSLVLLAAAAVLAGGLLLTADLSDPDGELSVPKRYSPEANEAYLSTRPLMVWQRIAKVSAGFAKFFVALQIDKQLGKEMENEAVRAAQLRNTIEELGPTYVKVAQALSTRVDMLTPQYFKEIERLQDRVPTFDDAIAYQAIEQELGRPVSDVFERLSPSPVASASLGQVYRGKLRGGDEREVAVKVQRPGVLCQVSLDLYVMRILATTVIKSWQASQTDYAALIDEWAVRFFQEMDYEQEAKNAIQFKKDMASLEGIVVPDFYEDLCTRKVLVSEWIEGEKLSESSAPDVKELCNTLLNAYLIQLLDTGFLHADPHPGNLIRTPEGKICIIDYGLMTTITKEQRDNLVDYIAKLTTQDWEGVAYALQGLGFIPKGAPDPVESGLVEPLGFVFSQLVKGGGARDMAKRIRANPGITKVRQQLDDLSNDYPFQVPTFFALILRAFSVIEGIALRVDPEFSIVMACFPYMSRRLLTDNSPRMNQILKGMLYGKKQRLDVERLQTMSDGLKSFTVDGLQNRSNKAGPIVDSTVKEALLVLFSAKGSYLQDLLVDEMVAAVDALSRESLSRIFTSYLGSIPVTAALRTADALGPLRPFALPFITPAEVVQRLAPAVATTAEDQEALSVVRGLFEIFQQIDSTTQSMPDSRFVSQAAEELSPILPELLPGVARTGELFARRFLSRVIMRAANVLDSTDEFNQSMNALD
ncbi:hypothetical protein BSKO_06578 [Bryopsis sp. KO-2023]|nr:hypothetical protein BSKO_06578 [Bryopsis sp. KO-2023]